MRPEARDLVAGCSRTGLAIVAAVCMFVSIITPACAIEATGIEGRWRTIQGDQLTLDIRRCGERYCGRLVKADNRCDRTVLTVALKTVSAERGLEFEGKLDLPAHPDVRRALVMVRNPVQAPNVGMTIIGDATDVSLIRRTFPFQAYLARSGEALCPPAATS
jgi:hypothetical protein